MCKYAGGCAHSFCYFLCRPISCESCNFTILEQVVGLLAWCFGLRGPSKALEHENFEHLATETICKLFICARHGRKLLLVHIVRCHFYLGFLGLTNGEVLVCG